MSTTPLPPENLPKLIERIQKLLALARGHANEHESASALAEAQRLMAKYSLDMSAVDSESEPTFCREAVEEFVRMPLWHDQLLGAVQRANGIFVVSEAFEESQGVSGRWTVYRRLLFVGRRTDVLVAKYMYGFLRQEIDSLAHTRGKGLGVAWMNEYRLGCVEAVAEKLQAATKAAIDDFKATSPGAIVHQPEDRAAAAKHWFLQGYGPVVKAPVRIDPPLSDARSEGRRDGQTIDPLRPGHPLEPPMPALPQGK